jgi:hypothetical protein
MSTAKESALERIRTVRARAQEKVNAFRDGVAKGERINRTIAWGREACMGEHVALGLARAEELLSECGDDAAAVEAALGGEAGRVRERILRNAPDSQSTGVMHAAVARVEDAADRELLERLTEAIEWARHSAEAGVPARKEA